MKATDVYGFLVGRASREGCDGFDTHVVASVLSLAVTEGQTEGAPVTDGMGLATADLIDLVGEMFPHAQPLFETIGEGNAEPLSETEACLRELLRRHATTGSRFQERLSRIVARRTQRPHHLWQDLGLRHRRELSWVFGRHFETLAARNTRDMRWKKFLYRSICREEGFTVCVAPTCSECDEVAACFGDERGDSLVSSPEALPAIR